MEYCLIKIKLRELYVEFNFWNKLLLKTECSSHHKTFHYALLPPEVPSLGADWQLPKQKWEQATHNALHRASSRAQNNAWQTQPLRGLANGTKSHILPRACSHQRSPLRSLLFLFYKFMSFQPTRRTWRQDVLLIFVVSGGQRRFNWFSCLHLLLGPQHLSMGTAN